MQFQMPLQFPCRYRTVSFFTPTDETLPIIVDIEETKFVATAKVFSGDSSIEFLYTPQKCFRFSNRLVLEG